MQAANLNACVAGFRDDWSVPGELGDDPQAAARSAMVMIARGRMPVVLADRWCQDRHRQRDRAVTCAAPSLSATMRVLVVEDHGRLASAVAEGLRREGMAVDLAFDGHEALAHVTVNRYDVVVLDRDLPGVHGDQVCRALVASGGETRVLMLTAASTIRDRVEGLELGADDYLPKPS
jgi:CheY-like chemotaxis protein